MELTYNRYEAMDLKFNVSCNEKYVKLPRMVLFWQRSCCVCTRPWGPWARENDWSSAFLCKPSDHWSKLRAWCQRRPNPDKQNQDFPFNLRWSCIQSLHVSDAAIMTIKANRDIPQNTTLNYWWFNQIIHCNKLHFDLTGQPIYPHDYAM